jgi:hypothetical protein
VLYNVLLENRSQILKTASECGIQNVRVFGSVAKLEDGPNSDLDLLVEFKDDRSLFDLIGFKQQIEELHRVQVHVVTENSINKNMRDDVINSAIKL